MILVKNHFNIKGDIKYFDGKTSSFIHEDDVMDYINQYKSSPGWTLGVLDEEKEIQGKNLKDLRYSQTGATILVILIPTKNKF